MAKEKGGFKQIIGGGPIVTAFVRRQIPLLIEIVFFVILYICNRYDSQRDQIFIEKLRRELVDVQYQALNTTSDVSAKSKPSYIESVVCVNGSGLSTTEEPPFKLPY